MARILARSPRKRPYDLRRIAGLALAALGALVLILGKRLPRERRAWLFIVAMAVAGNVLPFLLITWGQQGIDSGLAGILMAIMPLTTLVLAHFFVAGEHLSARKGAGFALGFAGVALLTGPDALAGLGGDASEIAHQAAILLGAVCYAVNTILARHLPAMHPIVSAACTMLMASAIMVPIALAVDAPWRLAPSSTSMASALWLGLVPTGVATVLYFRIVSTAGPTFLSLMNYAIPAVALGTGIVVLGEPFDGSVLAALALILAGLSVSQTGARAARESAS